MCPGTALLLIGEPFKPLAIRGRTLREDMLDRDDAVIVVRALVGEQLVEAEEQRPRRGQSIDRTSKHRAGLRSLGWAEIEGRFVVFDIAAFLKDLKHPRIAFETVIDGFASK